MSLADWLILASMLPLVAVFGACAFRQWLRNAGQSPWHNLHK